MQVVGKAALEREHFPDVAEIMFQPGSGARNLGERHGHSGQHKPFRDGADGVRIALGNARRSRYDTRKRGAHHVRDGFAVVFAGDDGGNAPFAHGNIFGDHIAKARPEVAHRRFGHNFRIAQDGRGAGVI